MAAQILRLASALKMVAINAGNPAAFLTDIITGRITRTIAGNGRITISASSGGSSASWTLPQGMNDFDLVEIAKIALETLQTGVDDCGRSHLIGQMEVSQRKMSYGMFNNVNR